MVKRVLVLIGILLLTLGCVTCSKSDDMLDQSAEQLIQARWTIYKNVIYDLSGTIIDDSLVTYSGCSIFDYWEFRKDRRVYIVYYELLEDDCMEGIDKTRQWSIVGSKLNFLKYGIVYSLDIITLNKDELVTEEARVIYEMDKDLNLTEKNVLERVHYSKKR